jgi:hypothetical protein
MYKTTSLVPKVKLSLDLKSQAEYCAQIIEEHISSNVIEGWLLLGFSSIGNLGGFVFVWKKS